MWGGAKVIWHQNLYVSQAVSREESLLKAKYSQGTKGPLVLVTVQHKILGQDGTLAVTEERNFVYRRDKLDLSTSPPPQQPQQPQLEQDPMFSGKADWEETVYPDAKGLFQYSALTYNSHLIHYNETYTKQVEGYPDLLVHGPLTSTLLMSHFLRSKKKQHPHHTRIQPLKFTYRAHHPLFNNQPILLSAEDAKNRISLEAGMSACRVWASNPQGVVAMSGIVHYTSHHTRKESF